MKSSSTTGEVVSDPLPVERAVFATKVVTVGRHSGFRAPRLALKAIALACEQRAVECHASDHPSKEW